MQRERIWSGVTTVASILGGVMATRAVTAAWTSTTGKQPPDNPGDPATSWTEALGWAAVAGLSMGVGRVLARRLATDAWTAMEGSPPPLEAT